MANDTSSIMKTGYGKLSTKFVTTMVILVVLFIIAGSGGFGVLTSIGSALGSLTKMINFLPIYLSVAAWVFIAWWILKLFGGKK